MPAPPASPDGKPDLARDLACIARENNIYLVVNVLDWQPCTYGPADPKCPPPGVGLNSSHYLFNSNVIFAIAQGDRLLPGNERRISETT